MQRNIRSLAFIGIVASCAVAQAQWVEIGFAPEKSRYARGETMGIIMVARDAWGRRMPNVLLWVGERIGYQEDFGFTRFVWTNSAGEYRFNYRVPTNPNWDNMHICGATWHYGGYGERRIPIGR